MAKSNRPAGGLGSRVVKQVPVRVGAPAQKVSPRGVSQIGSALGNHATESAGKLRNAVEPVHVGPMGGMGSVPLGNAKALDVGKGGVGTGRTIYGSSGTNKTYGPVSGRLAHSLVKSSTSLALTALLLAGASKGESIMVETKLKGPSMAERIAARLRNSGEHAGQPGHEVVQKGTSPNRTFTNIHPGGGHVVPPKNEGNGR